MSGELYHHPLKSDREIRVLVVHSDAVDRPIRCSFSVTNLDSPCKFESISYAWGDSSRTHYIASRSGQSGINVPASCEQALRSVRFVNKDRFVWIDSVCINQDDLEEKAQQVGLMGQIYAAAIRTLVYLGEDDGSFAYLVHAISTLRSIPASPGGEDHPLYRAVQKVPEKHRHTIDGIVTIAFLANEIEYRIQDSFEPLQDFWDSFFERSWFSRMWVIQEAALSRDVRFHLGRQVANWGTVMALYNLVNFWWHQSDKSYYGHPIVCDRSILGTRIIDRQMQETQKSSTGYNFGGEFLLLRHRVGVYDDESYYARGTEELTYLDLVDLLYEMRLFGCKDDRDRLFAILSLFQGPIPPLLKPDYRSTNSVEKVFANVSIHQLRIGNFDVLAYAQGLSTTRADLPSWACDWASPPERSRLLTAKRLQKDLRVGTAADMMPVRPIAHDQSGTIVLRGMIFDELTFVGPTCSDNADETEFMRYYSMCIRVRHVLRFSQDIMRPDSLSDEYYEIYGGKEYLFQDPIELTPAWSENTIQRYTQGRAFATVGNLGKKDPSERSLTKATCLVPSSAQQGDLVCGILGFDVAVILRPLQRTYQLVGTTTCWKYTIADKAPDLDWGNLMSDKPQTPLQDFRLI